MVRRLAVAALLVLATCTVPNPEFCDAAKGCQEGFLCDLAGTLSSDGRTNVCVRQVSCVTNPALCVAPTPICSEGLCVACLGPNDCPAGQGICADGVCRGCEVDGECTAPGLGRCLVGDCVECRDAGDCEAGEVCDQTEHACRDCRADAECASEVCDMATSRCVDPSFIAYVSTTAGAASDQCTAASPCDSLSKGIARAVLIGPNGWVRLRPGVYTQSLTINQAVSISGEDADLRPTMPAVAPAITVVPGGAVTLQRVRITGGGVGAPVLSCQGVDSAPVFTAAILHLRGATIAGNLGLGLRADLCQLTAERNEINGNSKGGVDIRRSNFTVVNNIVTGNGREGLDLAASLVGGVNIEDSPYFAPSRIRFEHNTVNANRIRDNVQGAGVRCNLNLETITLRSSIVFDNIGPSQVMAECALAYSDVGQLGISGTGVINMPPILDARFRLTESSPCRDRADPLSPVTVDIDGQPRPAGSADMGADEY